jgi:hypothetical protein
MKKVCLAGMKPLKLKVKVIIIFQKIKKLKIVIILLKHKIFKLIRKKIKQRKMKIETAEFYKKINKCLNMQDH